MSLSATVDKARGNIVGAIVQKLIKPISSTVFFHPVYTMYGPGPWIAISGPYEEFHGRAFGVWICVKIIWLLQINESS